MRKSSASGSPSRRSKPLSAFEKDVASLGTLPITGMLLAIDPSSGSRDSQPGYAIFKEGRLIDAGHIRVTAGQAIHTRLFELRRSLAEDFTMPDVLVTENIPPFMGGGFNRNILNLHYSIGVVLSMFLVPTIRVTPMTWQKNISKENYRKTDMNDAIMIGYAVVKAVSDRAGIECATPYNEILELTHGESK